MVPRPYLYTATVPGTEAGEVRNADKPVDLAGSLIFPTKLDSKEVTSYQQSSPARTQRTASCGLVVPGFCLVDNWSHVFSPRFTVGVIKFNRIKD